MRSDCGTQPNGDVLAYKATQGRAGKSFGVSAATLASMPRSIADRCPGKLRQRYGRVIPARLTRQFNSKRSDFLVVDGKCRPLADIGPDIQPRAALTDKGL